jgi:hypothetical protein
MVMRRMQHGVVLYRGRLIRGLRGNAKGASQHEQYGNPRTFHVASNVSAQSIESNLSI